MFLTIHIRDYSVLLPEPDALGIKGIITMTMKPAVINNILILRHIEPSNLSASIKFHKNTKKRGKQA